MLGTVRLQVLLAGGLRRLLDMAGSAGVPNSEPPPEPWPRVHALNMLRMAFSERGLALDGSAFLAEGERRMWLHACPGVGFSVSQQRALKWPSAIPAADAEDGGPVTVRASGQEPLDRECWLMT